MALPFLDLTRQYGEIKTEIDDAVNRVVASGIYIGGEEVTLFEEESAAFSSVKYGVSVSSGTDALLASLIALGITEGDEVITTPFTFIATAEVIAFLRAKAVFVDIEKETFNINPELIVTKITERTKCIIPVHLFGHMADMKKINEIAAHHGLKVLEDAAQAIGATMNNRMACSFGDAGCLSFFPSKNLGAFGDGGMVLTDNKEIADAVRTIKNHGSDKRYYHTRVGMNGRLDAIQAAVLRVKLKHLNQWVEMRRANAHFYNEMLGECITVPETKDGFRHVYNQYSLLTDKREKLVQYLRGKGIPSVIYYPVPLHMQQVFEYLGYRKGDFPVSEEISGKILSLPIFPELTEKERELIAKTVLSFCTGS